LSKDLELKNVLNNENLNNKFRNIFKYEIFNKSLNYCNRLISFDNNVLNRKKKLLIFLRVIIKTYNTRI